MKLTLEHALIRWSVVCTARRERFGNGHDPLLSPFVAGWVMRDMGATEPTFEQLGTFRDSFRAGWHEADTALRILEAQERA